MLGIEQCGLVSAFPQGTGAAVLVIEMLLSIESDPIGPLLLDTLRAEGIAENTLVVWWSDNGSMDSFYPTGGSTWLSVAMVDQKHQVTVYAKVFGEAQEQHLLEPMIEKTKEEFRSIGGPDNIFEKTKLVVDAGFHTEENMEMLFKEGIDVSGIRIRKHRARFTSSRE